MNIRKRGVIPLLMPAVLWKCKRSRSSYPGWLSVLRIYFTVLYRPGNLTEKKLTSRRHSGEYRGKWGDPFVVLSVYWDNLDLTKRYFLP